MLGWFKKKFKKKTDSAPQEETLQAQIAVAEEVEIPPQEIPATEKDEPTLTGTETDKQSSPAHVAEIEVETVPTELVEEKITEPPLSLKKEEESSIVTTTQEVVTPAIVEDEPEEEKQSEASPPPVTPDVPERQTGKEVKKPSLFKKLSAKLARSREAFTYQLDSLFLGKKEIDANLLDDLEELLIMADLGVSTTEEILEFARRKTKRKELSDPAALKSAIKNKIASFIEEAQEDAELVMPESGPFIIMVVGVNGVGKTTTIGKIAKKFVNSGNSVMLVAADTFRAAAVSQLKIWGERNNIEVFSRKEGADPSSVAYDAIATAVEENYDVVLIDTAGRLHTQTNLMEELKKIKRVIGKNCATAPHEVMLVIDATTGQNGISQAKLFNDAVGVTGITLTKLDGTAKGGIVANISRELNTPIRFIGIGEQIDDLRDFDHNEFIEALFQTKDN